MTGEYTFYHCQLQCILASHWTTLWYDVIFLVPFCTFSLQCIYTVVIEVVTNILQKITKVKKLFIIARIKDFFLIEDQLFTASYYRQFIKIIKLILVLLARPQQALKTGFNLITFHFNIRGKLSIIRCNNNKYSSISNLGIFLLIRN